MFLWVTMETWIHYAIYIWVVKVVPPPLLGLSPPQTCFLVICNVLVVSLYILCIVQLRRPIVCSCTSRLVYPPSIKYSWTCGSVYSTVPLPPSVCVVYITANVFNSLPAFLVQFKDMTTSSRLTTRCHQSTSVCNMNASCTHTCLLCCLLSGRA